MNFERGKDPKNAMSIGMSPVDFLVHKIN